MGLARRQLGVYHTRLKRSTTITTVRKDALNPMTLIVEFDFAFPVGYFLDEDEIIYGLYLDRRFIREFYEKKIKVQLESKDVSHVLEIFAHPHPGFEFIRARSIPGNKIRIRFRAKNPNQKDIDKHKILWDNGTGSYQAKAMGFVDAVTGQVSGRYLESGEIQ